MIDRIIQSIEERNRHFAEPEPEHDGFVIINLYQEHSRLSGNSPPFYNGGWGKYVEGFDTKKVGGYSIIGEWIRKDDVITDTRSRQPVGQLILINDIDGSRKNQRKEYYLYVINADATLTLLAESDSKDWYIDFWEAIKNYGDNNQPPAPPPLPPPPAPPPVPEPPEPPEPEPLPPPPELDLPVVPPLPNLPSFPPILPPAPVPELPSPPSFPPPQPVPYVEAEREEEKSNNWILISLAFGIFLYYIMKGDEK